MSAGPVTRTGKWWISPALLIAVMASIATLPAKAADSQLWAFCSGTQWVPMDQRVAACNAIIEASDETAANLALAHCNRSIAYSIKGNLDLATADVTEAVRLGLGEYQGLMCRGYGYLYKNDLDNAINYYDQAIKLDSKLPAAFTARGNAHVRKKEYGDGIHDYTEAIQRNPKDAIALLNRGNAYLVMKNYDDAIADFDAVINLDPTRRTAFTARASAFLGKGDAKRANADIEEAKRIRESGH